jgi:glyoxylase-like metal-dependent hydrolase (beta-lactamase superfamily II)
MAGSSMHRTTLGDFELTVVSDGTYFLDGGAFFGVVPKPMWSRKAAPDEQNRLDAGLNSLLIRTGSKNILVETGIGNKLPEKLVQIYKQPARLLENLHAAGVAPEDIDIVINTHLHFDHCGWNTVRRGDTVVATFPKAKYYAQQGEWEHGRLQLERDAVSYMSPNYDPLVESGQMELIEGDREIVPGVSVQVFPGHTANMQAVVVSGGGKTACYISDLIPTSWHLEPTWVMAFDLFPLDTIQSRKNYYARAISERWLTVFTHDDATPWGYVERGEKGRLAVSGL